MIAIYEEHQKLYNKSFEKEDYMPLSQAVEKLRQEALKQTQYGYSIDSHLKMQNIDNEFDRLARLFSEQIDIYGKQPSSSIGNWVKINDYVDYGVFKKRASELHLNNYYNRGPEFDDLAIKKDDLRRAIDEIISSNKLYQG